MAIICLKKYNQKTLALNKKDELRSTKNALLNKKAGSARLDKKRWRLTKTMRLYIGDMEPIQGSRCVVSVTPRVRRTAFATRGY